MAAGLGTRLRPFTEDFPKPLVPVLGIPLLEWNLRFVEEQGFRNIFLNAHHLPRQVQDYLKGRASTKSSIQVSDESKLLLGSGGGISRVLKQFPILQGSPLLVFNADVLMSIDLEILKAFHEAQKLKTKTNFTLALGRVPSGRYREVLFDQLSRRAQGLGEVKSGAPFFLGASVMEPASFEKLSDEVPSDLFPAVLNSAMSRGEVATYSVGNATWFDFGDPESWWSSQLQILKLVDHDRAPPIWREILNSKLVELKPGVWIDRKVVSEIQVQLSSRLQAPTVLACSSEALRILDQSRDIGSELFVYGNPSSAFLRGQELMKVLICGDRQFRPGTK